MTTSGSRLTDADITAAMQRHRSAVGSAMVGNFIGAPPGFSPRLLCDDEEVTAFYHEDVGFTRLYLYAQSEAAATRALSSCPLPGTLVMDVVAREGREPQSTLDAVRGAGFQDYSLFRRIRNPKLPVFDANERKEFAEESDADGVLALLNETFDPLNSHFPPVDVLRAYIRQQNVLVNRDDAGGLCGLSIFHMQGKVCNYDYLVNSSEDGADTLALLFNTYALLGERGVTSAFAWVDETNTGVMQMHRRFGYTPDGTMDYTFVKKQ